MAVKADAAVRGEILWKFPAEKTGYHFANFLHHVHLLDFVPLWEFPQRSIRDITRTPDTDRQTPGGRVSAMAVMTTSSSCQIGRAKEIPQFRHARWCTEERPTG